MRLTSLICCVLALALGIAGCGSGSNHITVSLSPGSTQSAIAGQTISATASVANDSKNAGVTWSLSGSGALSAQTTSSVIYTAPSPISVSGTATLTATSVSDSTKAATLTINMQAVSISLAPASPQTLDQAQTFPITATVSGDPGSKGVTWNLTGAGTLSGQTATSVTYNAPSSVSASSSPTITATSVFDNTKTATFTVNLVPPPSITTTSLAAGTVGVAYSASLAASNGVTPYTWSVTTGSLPAGLTLSGNSISGTPTAYGTSSFTVQVKDASGLTSTANLSIKIAPAPLAISTASLPNAVANSIYSAALASTGGATPISWSVTAGTLPAGLTLNATTGAISGTPTTAGMSNFTVQAADSSNPALTATKALNITVIPVLSVTTSTLASGITSTTYNATLVSTGGVSPVNWSVTVGALPAGLSLNAGTGAITGTPTTAGTSAFTVQAADSGTPQQKATKALSITVIQQLVINTTSLPTGAVTSNYTATLQSSGGTPAITWAISAGALPGGLALNAVTGAITGVPTASGNFQFTAQATDAGTPQQVVTKQLNITINPVLAITTTSPMASGTVNTAYSQPVQTNGGGIAPLAWSITAGALPTGVTLNANTGVIAGTPTATGTFTFTVQAADAGTPQQTASKALSISIATAPLSVATSGLPNGIVGQAYSNGILQSAGGTPPVTWSISTGSLPSWASLNASTGAITGTPNAAGTTTFTVKATDSSTPTPQTATKQLNINVVSALSITTSSLPNGTVGSAYNAPVAATGGTTPYTWSWIAQSGSSLPPGLSINSSTGAITGTAGGSGGTYNVTVTVTDASSPQQHTSANYSITITVSTLTVTTTSGNLPQGTVNSLYPNTNLSASGGVPPYSWTLSSGTLPPGLILNTAGTISGTPTTATGSPFGFTVKVTDSATPTANTNTANLSITVNAVAVGCDTSLTGKESLLQGDYTFVQSGFDSAKNPALLGGVFTASGTAGAGNLTAGTIDMNLNAGVQSNLSLTSASKYNLGQDATNGFRGCMTLVTSAGTQHFAFSVDAVGVITAGVASNGHIIGFDAAGPFTSGIIRQANSAAFTTSSITGSWVFGVAGPRNPASGGGKFSAAGVIAFAGGSVSGIADSNTNGTIDGSLTAYPASAGITLSSGPYSISSNGRGTMQFTPSGSASAVNSFLYVVSSSEMLIISADPQSGNDPYFGRVIKQSGSFSNASLTGNHVIFSAGPSNSVAGGSRTELDLVSTPSGNTFDFAGYQNDSGTTADPTTNSGSGTFNVASNGRVTLTCGACGHLPIFYLTSANNGFFLSGDSTAASGVFLPQASGSFTTSSISGIYGIGSYAPDVFGEIDNSGALTFTPGTAAVSGTVDLSSQGALGPDTAVSNTYSVNSSGVVLEPSGCTLTGASANCNNLLIILSPTQVVMMKVTPTNTKPSLFLLEQ